MSRDVSIFIFCLKTAVENTKHENLINIETLAQAIRQLSGKIYKKAPGSRGF
jgi:hypothetical protein